MTERTDYLTAAKAALEAHYPMAVCAFVAGSVIRGTATEKSDIDITVILPPEHEDVHRFSTIHEGWPIEFFVQNEKANQYFMNKDRNRGMAVMMDMMMNGKALPEENATTKRIRTEAKKLLELGPPKLTADEIDDRRYFITDLLDDLDPSRPKLEIIGIAARLYELLGDFYLRTQGKWSGHSKSLARILKQTDPAFADQYEAAFKHAFKGQIDALVKLIDDVLTPHGGPLFEGYKREAPADWRDFRKLYAK